jgi:hypothetical protein
MVLTRTERSGEFDGAKFNVAPALNTLRSSKKSSKPKTEHINSKVFVGTEVRQSRVTFVLTLRKQGEVLYLDWKQPEGSEGKAAGSYVRHA